MVTYQPEPAGFGGQLNLSPGMDAQVMAASHLPRPCVATHWARQRGDRGLSQTTCRQLGELGHVSRVLVAFASPRARANRLISYWPDQEATVTSSVRSLELRESPALLQILEPGDRIVAAMVASEGLWLLISTLVTLILVLTFFLAAVITRDAHVYLPILIASAAVNAAVQSRQKIYFVVVTERQLICHRLSRFAWRLTRLLFTAPLAAAHVTVGGQTPLGKSVRYSGPGPQRQGLHLYVGNRSAGDLEEVLAALQAGGASVAGLP